jgi:hypothetical protein
LNEQDEIIEQETSLAVEQDSVHLARFDLVSHHSEMETRESFAIRSSHRKISSLVLPGNRSVRDFMGEGHSAAEIGRLAAEGIRQEGLRCLESQFEEGEGQRLYAEFHQCDTIESLLRVSGELYTRNSFLYRRVNRFLRSAMESDSETGTNLGLYIGLLRECFCVRDQFSPVSWECPTVLYRGADFGLDNLADYARRPDELIRWQSFTSSSREMGVALGFGGNVLFEISLSHSVASLDEISAFRNEHECILSPYQWFSVTAVRWNCDCGRWIVSVREETSAQTVPSWFVKVNAAPDSAAESK